MSAPSVRSTHQYHIVFSAQRTARFICMLILDTLHDTAPQSAITEQGVRALVSLYLGWVIAINFPFPSARDKGLIIALRDAVLNRFGGMVGHAPGAIAGQILSNIKRQAARQQLDMLTHAIIDNACGDSRDAPTFCERARQVKIATYSTLYDRGAYRASCRPQLVAAFDGPEPDQQTRAYRTPAARAGVLRDVDDNDVTFRTFSVAACDGMQAREPEDIIIFGTVADDRGAEHLIILACRGARPARHPHHARPFIRFVHRAGDGYNIVRGYSQSQSVARDIARRWMRYYDAKRPSIMDIAHDQAAQRAQVELSAKNWGDLGMVADAKRIRGTFIATNDNMMKIFCAEIGAPFVTPDLHGFAYVVPPSGVTTSDGFTLPIFTT